jgi:hypothetical protein
MEEIIHAYEILCSVDREVIVSFPGVEPDQ